MLITDNKKMLHIKMTSTEGHLNTEDVMVDSSYEWSDDIEAWVVDELESVIDYAREWERFETEIDFEMLHYDEHIFDGHSRYVEIKEISKNDNKTI